MGPVERFVAAALRQRPFVLLCLAAFVVTGLVAWREVPIEAFPDLTNNQVVVVTEAPGLAAVEVEQRVTYPIETALMGAPGATEVRSLSKFGLSMITVVFEDRVPVYFARQLVTERLSEARGRIPDGLEPSLGPVATAFGEIYQYLVEGDADPMEKKTLHDWDVRARLRSVRGVSEVNSWGGLTKQYHVVVRPRQLERYGLSLHQVVEAVTANNASFSGGFVEHRSERFTVRGSGLATGVEDLRRIVLASVEGVPVLVGDVADVGTGPLPRSGAVTRDGKGETVAGMVIMLQGENGKDVATRVKARIAEIEKTLPAGMRIAPFYDQSEVIDRTSHTVTKNLLEGSLLVVAVLFFFLRDVRASLIVASVIPLAMLAGFLGMRFFGVSANLMSLGAIDFGLIVDGAVVMMENFIRRRAEHDPTGEPDFVADPASHRRRFFTSAAVEVARPVLFGVLIIVAVYVPVFTLEGLEGKMFRPMAITVCSAILGALVLALTVVPVASFYLLKIEGTEREEGWFLRLRRYYVAHLEDAMNHPRRTLCGGVRGGPGGGRVRLPPRHRVHAAPRRGGDPGRDPQAALHLARGVGGHLHAGRADHPALPRGEAGRHQDRAPRRGDRGHGHLPGRRLRQPAPHRRVEERLVEGGADRPHGGSARGDAGGRLQLHPAHGHAPRRGGLRGEGGRRGQGVRARPRHPGAGGGADPGGARRGARGGRPAGRGALRGGAGADRRRPLPDRALRPQRGGRARARGDGDRGCDRHRDPRRPAPVRRRGPLPGRRARRPGAAGAAPADRPGGEKVPLASVADIRTLQGPEAVNHESGQRRLVVQTNVRGRDVGSFVAEAQQRMASAVKLPAGYFVEWGGQFENQERATRRLMVVIPASLAIIFLLLFLTFGKVRQAALVILNVPFALVGGIAALWIRGLNLNLSASVGFIALFGVAVLNGIVMIAAINRLREEGHLELRPSILRGAATRLKPVMMTALVAALGFVPMALSHGAGAEVQRPLASVVIGGITTSTLLTLIVLPTLYELIEAWVLRRQEED